MTSFSYPFSQVTRLVEPYCIAAICFSGNFSIELITNATYITCLGFALNFKHKPAKLNNLIKKTHSWHSRLRGPFRRTSPFKTKLLFPWSTFTELHCVLYKINPGKNSKTLIYLHIWYRNKWLNSSIAPYCYSERLSSVSKSAFVHVRFDFHSWKTLFNELSLDLFLFFFCFRKAHQIVWKPLSS